jgi:hypothetical protein
VPAGGLGISGGARRARTSPVLASSGTGRLTAPGASQALTAR